MKKLLIISLLNFVTYASIAQSNLTTVAFYNVENLFDTIDDPEIRDEEFTPDSDKLWGEKRYNKKLTDLAKVIQKLGDKNGPEILGLAEVENRKVLEDLIAHKHLKKRRYAIAHFESPDYRGIDVALLYKKKWLSNVKATVVPVIFEDNPKYKTRDILLVKGETKGQKVHFLVNHWPSRRGGQEKSEPNRVKVASIARDIVDSLFQLSHQSNIIVMGDFNDEPSNKSMIEVLKAKSKSFEASKGELFNAMASLEQKEKGSYLYRGNWDMLDQIIISSNLLESSNGWQYINESATILKEEWLLQDGSDNPKYKGYPLKTFAGTKYLGGYSDHLPVFIQLKYLK